MILLPKRSFFMLTIFLATSRIFAADITVDNNPGAVADFANLQAAVNGATDGDRILVAGSPTNYGLVYLYVDNGDGTYTMRNNLTIVGPSYFRNENGVPPNASGINNPATFTLHLGGSTLNRDLDGLTVIGCHIGLSTLGENSNVLIDRCYVTGFITLSAETNVNFTRCYFVNSLKIADSINCSITSSIVGGLILEDSSIASHCVIRGDSIHNTQGVCFIDAGLPSGGDNIDNQTLTAVVVGTGSLDARWSLAASSPASNAASDGTDIGAFGSASPYQLSGLSGAPTITRLLVPAIASPTTGLLIEVDIEQPAN